MPLAQKAACLSLSVFMLVFSFGADVSGAEDTLSVKELKAAIHDAITNARQLADQEPYFKVVEVKMELSGSTSSDGGGGFKIPIWGFSVDLGAKAEVLEEEKLTIVMKPADNVVVGGELNIDLAGLIKDVREAFAREKNENPDYIITELNYETKWALKRTAEGSIDFVIASGDVAISKEKQQTIVFTLCETVNYVDCIE